MIIKCSEIGNKKIPTTVSAHNKKQINNLTMVKEITPVYKTLVHGQEEFVKQLFRIFVSSILIAEKERYCKKYCSIKF